MIRVFHKRSLLQSQKLVRRKQLWHTLKISSLVLLLVGFIWSLSYISAAPQFTIQHVIISGNSAISTEDISAVANEALAGKYFWLFSRANIFLYPKNEILNTLRYSYLWIDNVSINKVDLNTIEIKVKERVPVAVWCGVLETNPAPCQLMDADGYLFAAAPDFSGAAYLRLYGPLTSASWRGARFFSDSGRSHILKLTSTLSNLSLKTVSVQVLSPSVRDEYNLFLENGTCIEVLASESVDEIISNLQSLLSQKTFAQSLKPDFSNLDYIDMRFGNKIFYKFKSAGASTEASTATSSQM